MPKLKKFNNQKEKKISTKNLFIAFGIIIGLLSVGYVYKSYAIYKMQKEFDVIKTQIGSYSMGDIRIGVLVDGKEVSEFPSYETNYKVEKIECTNGVVGQWDTKNWRLVVDDMSATSTKCTIHFNSNETNSETPIAYSKEELIAINEEIKNTTALQLADKLYPIGSIYMSTTEDTVEKVQSKFGGTWVKYSEGRTLIGVGSNGTSTYTANQTGGSTSVTLKTENLPSHSHEYTPMGKVESSFTGDQVNSSVAKASQDLNALMASDSDTATVATGRQWIMGYAVQKSELGYYKQNTSNFPGAGHYHTITPTGNVTSDFTGTTTNTQNTGNGTAFTIQNPYIAVYMYKRTA